MSENYGRILENALTVRKWKPEKLAVEADTSVNTVNKALAGSERINIPTLKRIAQTVGYELELVLKPIYEEAETALPE